MHAIRIIQTVLLTLALAGCVNFKEVRDYAGEAAKLSAYTELTTRFRDTYEREQPYLSGEAERLAKENDKKRKAAYADLIKIHQRVSLYMQTLARLAGEDTFDFTPEIGSLASGIKTHTDFGIEVKHVDAVANIAKVITKWLTSSYQEHVVRSMIKEGDADLQATLEGMMTLVRYYKETNDNERKTVLGFFEMEIPFADAPKDKLLATLARVQVQAKTAEYKNAQLRYADAEQGIRSIAEGHARLLENIDRLSHVEVKGMIGKFARDIKAMRENLQATYD